MTVQRRSLVIAAAAVVAVTLAVAAGTSALGAAGQDPSPPQQSPRMAPPPPPGGPNGRGGRGGGPGGRGGPGGFGMLDGPILFELDLSAEQLERVKALREEARTSSEPYQELLWKLQDELGALVLSDSFDEAATRALALAEAKAMAELRVIGARAEAATYQVLTPDQKATLAEARPGRRLRR